jgi:hypothetical protein
MTKEISSATITISRAHSPKRAIAGRDMLTELGYEDATIGDAQKVFDAMLYVPGSPPEYHSYEEQMAFETRLLMLIAEIREVTGVGQKPMLTELADAIRDKINALKQTDQPQE